MEAPGIDPGTSRMLSERSTIWATPPILGSLLYCLYIYLFNTTRSPLLLDWGEIQSEHTLVPSKVYLVSDDSRADMDFFLGVIDCMFRKPKDNESR